MGAITEDNIHVHVVGGYGRGGSRGPGGVTSEKNPGIHFYSGFREKKHKGGGVQFEILKNPDRLL